MKLEFRTLTPLWTGGVETRKMDRVHETGIIGSLRWWYEAILRGLGGEVCNPTSDQSGDRCPRDGDHYCEVCQLFGATGQRRKFRLCVREGQALFNANARDTPIPSGRIHTRPRLRAGRWYLMGSSVMGDHIPMHVIPLATPDALPHLRMILSLIDRHAAVSAKVSNGYGVIHFCEDGQPIEVHIPDSLSDRSQPPRERTLPDIRDFFFAKFEFQTPAGHATWWRSVKGISDAWNGQVTDGEQSVNVYHQDDNRNEGQRNQARSILRNIIQGSLSVRRGLLPIAPAIRNWLRYSWNSSLTDPQKSYLFGTINTVCPLCCMNPGRSGFREERNNRQNYWCPSCRCAFPKGHELERIASKINVSHAYQLGGDEWEFRVWGWIPCQSPVNLGLRRDQFLADLRATMDAPATWQWVFNASSPRPSLVEWHSLDCRQSDGLAYLKELLGLNEGGIA